MPQPDTDLRKELSQILVKWSMPTHQAAINEVLALVHWAEAEGKNEVIAEAIAKIERMKNRPDNCIMNSAREKENTLLNQTISLLGSLRDRTNNNQ